MRYMLSVEVKLVELPDPPEIIEMTKHPDPLENLGKIGAKLLEQGVAAIPLMGMRGAGIDFHKSAVVSAASFAALAHILEQYDKLTGEIELERA